MMTFKNETADSMEVCIPVAVSASVRFWLAEGDDLTADTINARVSELAFAAEADVIRLPSFNTGDLCMNVLGVEPGAKADLYNREAEGQESLPGGVEYAPPTCFALMIDDDDSAELYLFGSETERESFMWDYAIDHAGWDGPDDPDAEPMDEFKAEFDGDLSDAMDACHCGWKTDER